MIYSILFNLTVLIFGIFILRDYFNFNPVIQSLAKNFLWAGVLVMTLGVTGLALSSTFYDWYIHPEKWITILNQ